MGAYDSRHITLDPGLTALALRGLHERDGNYPFLDRFLRRRRPRRPSADAAATAGASGAATIAAPRAVDTRLRARAAAARAADRSANGAPAPFLPRSLDVEKLFPTWRRLRAPRGPSSAAA